MEYEGAGDTSCKWSTWNNPQRLGNVTGSLGNNRRSAEHPHYNVIKIVQNTEKSPEDLRRLAVTQTSVKNYQLKVMRKKTVKRVKKNYNNKYSFSLDTFKNNTYTHIHKNI